MLILTNLNAFPHFLKSEFRINLFLYSQIITFKRLFLLSLLKVKEATMKLEERLESVWLD